MNIYNPEHAPNPKEWLALDEDERIRLCEQFHRRIKQKMPNVKVHAIFHSVAENQIAENLEPVVRAMARLKTDGLSRHDAIHAVASVAAKHFYEVMSGAAEYDSEMSAQERYNMDIDNLTATNWYDDDDDE